MKLQFIFLSYVKLLFTCTSTDVGEIKRYNYRKFMYWWNYAIMVDFNKVAKAAEEAVESPHNVKGILAT